MVTQQLVLALLPLLGAVSGHGGVYNYTINGVSYAGQYPWLLEDQQPESIQRRWYYDPIQAVDHPYLSCNRGNPLASRNPSLHAPVTAGSNITAHYIPPPCPPNFHQPTKASTPWANEPDPPGPCNGPEYSWPHGLGPLLVYMADCGGPCEDFKPEGKKVWFKIYEAGFHPGFDTVFGTSYERDIGGGRGWDQSVYTRDGWSVRIPKGLKPGNYLIRHEIIMIELMPPQFYPECAQLTVMGEGDRVPAEEDLVAFPGAYHMDEPGLAVAGTVYTPKGHQTRNYTIPGPKVWTGADE